MMTEPERYIAFSEFEDEEYIWDVVVLIDLEKFNITKFKNINASFLDTYVGCINIDIINHDYLMWDAHSNFLSTSAKEYIEECFRKYKLKAFL